MDKFLNKLERKTGRFAVPDFMKYIVFGMALFFVISILFRKPVMIMGQPTSILELFTLNKDAIFSGQIWRLVTFVFFPPTSEPLFLIISLYFYYFLGSSLEKRWGTARFNLYYIMGIICAIAAAMIAQSIPFGGANTATNMYLNYSLFFAFAMLFPNEEFRLFFFLPVKVKYLAWLNAAFFAYMFIIGNWGDRIAIIASLLHFFLFFSSGVIHKIQVKITTYGTRRNFKKNMKR